VTVTTIFETAWAARLEPLMIDFAEDPIWPRILDIPFRYHCAAERLSRMGVDISGQETTSACSMADDLAQGLAAIPQAAHGRVHLRVESINPDVKVAYHSDGISSGSFRTDRDRTGRAQPRAVGQHGPRQAKRQYGDKLVFWGTIDEQHTLLRRPEPGARAGAGAASDRRLRRRLIISRRITFTGYAVENSGPWFTPLTAKTGERRNCGNRAFSPSRAVKAVCSHVHAAPAAWRAGRRASGSARADSRAMAIDVAAIDAEFVQLAIGADDSSRSVRRYTRRFSRYWRTNSKAISGSCCSHAAGGRSTRAARTRCAFLLSRHAEYDGAPQNYHAAALIHDRRMPRLHVGRPASPPWRVRRRDGAGRRVKLARPPRES